MYEYVIVGGGSAGCTLAHRLTEDDDVEVLLLEAGEPASDNEAVKDPSRVWELMESELDWAFKTEPQAQMHDRRIDWPRGKALGGSSMINGMAYIRGHPDDYDTWAELGNDGWSYDDLLPYFKRSENFQARGEMAYHGTDGPLSITRGDNPDDLTPSEFSEQLIEAAQEAGMERNLDFNGEQQAGVGWYHSTMQDGERHSAAKAFIEPVLDRPNLTVETGAHVTELTFEGDRATGAVYESDGQEHEVTVAEGGEVVMAAGAIQSPQLLLLSGIGPADHLEDHGIDVRADLPGVGRNLQDHLRVNVAYETTEDITPRDPEDQPETGPRYDRVLTGAFERSSADLPAPDIQYGLSAGLDPENPTEGFSIAALPLRPSSRGRITLASTDPYEDPIIDPQLLTTEKDRADIVTAIRRARRIAQADALDDVRGEEVRPGPDVQSDEEIFAYCGEIAESGYHPVGTCKMGDDELAVVDDELRVHGVEGLRVIDASIMPNLISGNTNAPTIAIAEKGADLLKEAR
ncbi:GMC family oxidoreductase [Halobellus clavatus]|uniref:Choline dehydrogenase n=1 Tax=Halobellus clavatus TaxID=660517 RepID=A0A1H3FUX0_9EURY|nr:GMC family oxidoreductase N-terminal domain-containing protein [Halobellus clavatus]SDX94607.1 choline dehydrogenase [Halobellus clavatus]